MVYLAVSCVFNGEDRHARGPLSLVPSLSLDSSDEYINDMLKWQRDLQCPKSLGSEVRRWKGLCMNIEVPVSGNSKQKVKFFLKLWVHVTAIPFQHPFPACCRLHITYIKCRSRLNDPCP